MDSVGRLLGIVVAVVSLLITPGLLFYFDITPKIIVLLAGTAVALVWAATSGTRTSGEAGSFRLFSALVFLTVLSLALSTALSARPALSLFGSNWRQYGSLVEATVCVLGWLVALTCAGRVDRVRTVLRAVSVAGAIGSVYGICQFFGWDPLLPTASYRVGEGALALVRPPGTLGYSSYFATWLLFVVFLSLALRNTEPARLWRRFAFATATLAGFAMVLTGTRAAILGLVAGAVAWQLVQRTRVRRRTLVFSSLAVAALAILYVSPAGRPLRARVRWSEEDRAGGARLTLWRDSLGMAVRHPLAGYGPEVFTSRFPEFESPRLAQSYPDFAHESPHNMFLDAFVAQGVPGLLLLAAMCATGLLAAFRLKLPAFTAALAAGIISQQFTAFTMPTALMLLVSIGLAVALETRAGEPKRRIPWIAGSAAIAAVLIYVAVRLGASDAALALAQQRLDRADLAGASQQYHRYENLRLPGRSAELWYSRALLALASQSQVPELRTKAMTEAAAAAVLATRTAEDPFNAWYNLAILCGTQENAGCAERSLRAAITAHPKWFKPHWSLARILSLEGRTEEALREAALAAELDGYKHAEVTTTLEQIRGGLAHQQSVVLQK